MILRNFDGAQLALHLSAILLSGYLTYRFVNWFSRVLKGLEGHDKFWVVIVLTFVLPPASYAYLFDSGLLEPFDTKGLLLVMSLSFAFSQVLHRHDKNRPKKGLGQC